MAITKEQCERIQRDAEYAKALLLMVAVVVRMPGDKKIQAYAWPVDCLDTAQQFHAAGAESVALFGLGQDQWFWFDLDRRST